MLGGPGGVVSVSRAGSSGCRETTVESSVIPRTVSMLLRRVPTGSGGNGQTIARFHGGTAVQALTYSEPTDSRQSLAGLTALGGTAEGRLQVLQRVVQRVGHVQAVVPGLDRGDARLERLHMPDQLRDDAGPMTAKGSVGVSRAVVRIGGGRNAKYIGRDQQQYVRVIGLTHYPSVDRPVSLCAPVRLPVDLEGECRGLVGTLHRRWLCGSPGGNVGNGFRG